MRILPLLPLLFAIGCTGPDAVTTKAQRDWWNADRAYLAIQTPTEADRQREQDMLAAVDARLTADEKILGQQQDPASQWGMLFALYGDALIGQEAGPLIKARDPAVFAALDADHDGNLTLAEIKALDPTKPANVPIVTALVIHMLSKHR